MNDKVTALFPTNMFPKHYIKPVTNNKNELLKTVRLTSFQKAQLQSVSIFFKFVHLFVPLCLLCLSNLLKTFLDFFYYGSTNVCMPRVNTKSLGWTENRNQPQYRLKFVVTITQQFAQKKGVQMI